jgi:DNA polymerase (family 10)
MDNKEVSKIFKEMAFFSELDGANVFRVRAYQRASEIIRELEKNVFEMDDDELLKINGIGKGILSHIKEIKERGSFDEFDKLKEKYPCSLFELSQIRGLGVKRIKVLYEKLNIKSKDDLIKSVKDGRLREIDGFGEKIEKTILESVEKEENLPKRFLYHIAKNTALSLIDYLKKNGYKRIEFAGSLRRGKETIGDIDILAIGSSQAIDIFVRNPLVDKVLAKGSLKASVLLKNGIQCDFRVFDEKSFGAALCYFTGSKAHNIRMRELALKKGYILNEYGLFKNNKSKDYVCGKTEEEIYSKLGLQYIPPELREDSGEIELATNNRIPKLVELKDIRADIHCHTSYTDGINSIQDIVDYLSKRYDWFFIGDHSSPLNFVKGLDFKKYNQTREELLKLKEKYRNVFFDRSLEVEILKDGNLSFKEDELKKVSLVISALHTSLKLDRNAQTQRFLKAIRNPYTDVVAHLTQRLFFERDEIDMDYDIIFEEAAKLNTVFEVNGQPERLDLSDVNLKRIKSLGLKVVLTSDAHSIEQFSFIEYSLNNARRAGLTRDDVLNCLSFKEFVEYIKENRVKKGGFYENTAN